MAISEGVVLQTRVEDLRPTTKHWVLLGVGLLSLAVAYMTLKLVTVIPIWVLSIDVLCIAVVVVNVFAHMLGGLPTIWQEWKSRNYVGIDQVLRKTTDGYQSDVQSARLRNKGALEKGWVLYLPFGGWFNHAGLYRDGHRQPLIINEIERGEVLTACEWLTVRDLAGNRLTLHPTELLDLMYVPERPYSISTLSTAVRNNLTLVGDLKRGRANLESMFRACGDSVTERTQILRDALEVIDQAIQRLEKTRRAQFLVKPANSTEAKPIRQWLQEQHNVLTKRLKGDAY